MSMLRAALFVLGTAGDAGWFLFGMAHWVLTLGAAEVTVSNALTKRSFRFPGWLT